MPKEDCSLNNQQKTSLKNARSLRKNMTRQERHLWYDFLRSYPVKFYRQRSINEFIADFYCSRAHLVIELDGSQHYEPDNMEYDRRRTELLNKNSLEVIRFSNLDIDRNFEDVCYAIDIKVKENLEKWESPARRG
jgi:very-short-patch-repair endonuclease